MTFRTPDLELRFPLRARPFTGAAAGALTGLTIGFLHSLTDNPEGGATAVSGLIGGTIAGLVVGLGLPGFFNRWLAGTTVTVAATIGLAAAFPRWGDDASWFIYPFIGAMFGIVYGVLLWKRPMPAKPLEPFKAGIDSLDA